MNITVYSSGRSCQKCQFTIRAFARKGIEPNYVDVSPEDYTLPADAAALGATVAPLVVVRDGEGTIIQWWQDARPDLIGALARDLALINA